MFHARIWEVYGLFRWGLQSLVSLTKGLKVFLRLRLHSIVTGLELSIRSNATKTPGRFICNPSSHVLVSFVPDCAICVTSSSTIGKNRFSSGYDFRIVASDCWSPGEGKSNAFAIVFAAL